MPWPGTIVQRVYGQVPNKAIQLANATWVRPVYVLSNWARIRIGMLVTVNNPSLVTIANCPLYFGMCSGSDNPIGFNLTRSFIGACVTGAANGTCTLTYSAGATTNYYTGAAPTACRKYENIWVTSSTGTAIVLAAYGPQTVEGPVNAFARERRTPIILDITRGDSGGGLLSTISMWSTVAATAAFDYTPADLLDGVNQTGAPIIAGQTLAVGLNAINTINVSDLMGCLDSICIYWSRAAFPLEIHAIAASVKYPTLYNTCDNTHGVDAFTQYGSGTLGGRSLNSGTGWSGSPWVLSGYGTNRGNPATMVAGDAGTYPFFGSYNSYGSISGTYWPFAGTQLPALYQGTTIGWPMDNFETFYSIGSLTSGVTINSGSGWATPGVIS